MTLSGEPTSLFDEEALARLADAPLSAFRTVAMGGMGADCPSEEEDSILFINNGHLIVLRNTDDRDKQCEVIDYLDL
jgi:hypothetical protein